MYWYVYVICCTVKLTAFCFVCKNSHSVKFQIPIAKYLSIEFFVDDCAKSCMLRPVDYTKSTLTNSVQV